MNNTIKLAVASALLAAASSASAAGGIVAGDWTLDVGGIVNMYATRTSYSGDDAAAAGPLGLGTGAQTTTTNIITGLLPNYLTVGGKTRQNDLDVSFLISIQPGSATRTSLSAGTTGENRQQFLQFGDASWGSIKLGKDLGVYASDAILNDMTLLGVGSGAGSLHGTTTLGGIGAGYIYADWKNQVAYTSPNFNGFSFTAALTQAWNQQNLLSLLPAGASSTAAKSPAFEAKVSYAFAGDVSGKVWASGISQKNDSITNAVAGHAAVNATTGATTAVAAVANTVADSSNTTTAWDIGANVNAAGFGLTGYYGDGKGIGQTLQFNGGLDANGLKRDSKQYYVQGTYSLPGVGTKLGVSYGESKLDGNAADTTWGSIKDSMWVGGVYHPVTKHLNLVAEYAESERKVADGASVADTSAKAKAKTVSLGAILFF